MPFLFSIIKSAIFKYLLLALSIVALVAGIYLKGRSDANTKWKQREAAEIVRRLDNERKVIDHSNKERKKLDNKRKIVPINELDSIYGCWLSNDPFTTNCTDN